MKGAKSTSKDAQLVKNASMLSDVYRHKQMPFRHLISYEAHMVKKEKGILVVACDGVCLCATGIVTSMLMSIRYSDVYYLMSFMPAHPFHDDQSFRIFGGGQWCTNDRAQNLINFLQGSQLKQTVLDFDQEDRNLEPVSTLLCSVESDDDSDVHTGRYAGTDIDLVLQAAIKVFQQFILKTRSANPSWCTEVDVMWNDFLAAMSRLLVAERSTSARNFL